MFQLIDSKFQIIQRKEKRLGITDKNSKADDGEGEIERERGICKFNKG